MTDAELQMQLRGILTRHEGPSFAYVKVAGDSPKTIKLPFRVGVVAELIGELGTLVGAENVQTVSNEIAVR